jgi:hypothetical protein
MVPRSEHGIWIALGFLVISVAGCASPLRPIARFALLSDDPMLVSTQMLRPGVQGRACAWSLPWREPSETVGSVAVRRCLEQVPDATLLENVSVEASALHLGVAVRHCVRVRGDARRRISEVLVPALDMSHGVHH